MPDIRFHSCLQTGLSTALETSADEFGVPASGVATISPRLRIAGINRNFSQEMTVRGPGDVMRLDPGVIGRVEPKNQERDVAPNFFPYIELSDAALPWQFTPARPNAGRLMPWLVLVVLPADDRVSLRRLTRVPGMALSISGGAGLLLPDLAESHAWAHVEDRSGQADAGAAFAARPGDFLARLMCPIRMDPRAAYIAALVPAFEAGRQAGLGQEVAETGAALAWTGATEAIDLPAYHHWEFTTGGDDFEALVRKLRGIPVDETVGLHDLDISTPRGGLDIGQVMGKRYADKKMLVSYRGALVSPIARPRRWQDEHRVPFTEAMHASLTPKVTKPRDSKSYKATHHDPVITAPVYGSFQGDRTKFERRKSAWMTEANHDPQYRANAGLGTRTIRRNQEQLMGKAWARAKGIDEVRGHLRQTRVALSVGSIVHARLDQLDAPEFIQLTTPVQSDITMRGGNTQTVAAHLEASPTLTSGVLDAAFRRSAAATQTRVKSLPTATDRSPTLQFEATRTSISGMVTTFDDRLPDLDQGARPYTSYTFEGVELHPELSLETLSRQVGLDMVPAKGVTAGTRITNPALVKDPKRAATIQNVLGDMQSTTFRKTLVSRSVAATNVNAVKQTIVAATLPRRVLPPLALARVEGVAKPPARRVEIPRSAQLTVEFGEPAYEFLARNGVEFLLPGFGAIADHSVSLLVTNSAFVESYLLGLNHELSREFAWRQFPAALSSTWFRRFWDYLGSEPAFDIQPIKGWRDNRKLGSGTSTNDAVVLVKSPLFRRYPDTLVYAVPAKWFPVEKLDEAEIAALKATSAKTEDGMVRLADFDDPGRIIKPSFSGKIATSAAFFGFPRDPLTLTGTPRPERGKGDAGYFIVFEQAQGNQKFGLDQPERFTPNRAPSSADALSWGHFAGSAEALAAMAHAPIDPVWSGRAIDGAVWGRTAADMAKLTLQSPVRIMFHASGLMETGGNSR